jgi:hypothetical protein
MRDDLSVRLHLGIGGERGRHLLDEKGDGEGEVPIRDRDCVGGDELPVQDALLVVRAQSRVGENLSGARLGLRDTREAEQAQRAHDEPSRPDTLMSRAWTLFLVSCVQVAR